MAQTMDYGISGEWKLSDQESTIQLIESGGFQLLSYTSFDETKGKTRNRAHFDDIGLASPLPPIALLIVGANDSIGDVVASQNGKQLVTMGRAFVAGQLQTVAVFR